MQETKPTKSNCDFCDELSGGCENPYSRIYGPDSGSRVLFRSNNFVVIPSLGQIAEGYLLVLPIEHFKAVGDLRGAHLDEFAAVSERIGNVLKDQYGSYILFEHGTRSEGVGGCGIYHAHLHAVPLAEVPDPVDVLKSKFPYTELTHLNEITERSAGLPAYLFYQASDAKLYLFDTGPLPSQYMRKLLADALGKAEWDWRTAGKEERLLATIRRFSTQFNPTRNFAHAPNP